MVLPVLPRALLKARLGATLCVAGALLVGLGCHRAKAGAPGESARPPEPAPPAPPDCAARVRAWRAEPSRLLSDLPPDERSALLAQVKATPVVFVERPEFTTTDPVARQWRHELETSQRPGHTLAKLLRRFRGFPAFVRSVVLTDGYLYATTPRLGETLAEGLTPERLFRERRIVIERGASRLTAERDEHGSYRYVDGDERGQLAHLVLFDRVFVAGSEPTPARHLDVAALREQLGFDALTLESSTADGIVAVAHYGHIAVPTLLSRKGSRLELVCEAPGATAKDVARARSLALRRARAFARVREAILAAVDERLPFDEPRTEFGQEDGKLRQEWRYAYLHGQRKYEFNGDEYQVFDGDGRPRVPEVCVDFILDSFERAGGSWYARRGEPRGRSGGRILFDGTGMLNRRNVEEFIALAGRRRDWFDLRLTPAAERVPLERRERFFATLYAHRAEYRTGDVVVILGERDDEKLHYHSFFVFDTDPVTGMPTLVAGNSGHPRVRAWATEMASAPKRSVFARVRPRLALLERTLDGSPGAPPRPLTAEAEQLSSGAP